LALAANTFLAAFTHSSFESWPSLSVSYSSRAGPARKSPIFRPPGPRPMTGTCPLDVPASCAATDAVRLATNVSRGGGRLNCMGGPLSFRAAAALASRARRSFIAS